MSGRRPYLNALLCGLLLVGSAATTVRHDHGHAADSHHHLLLFGFEAYEGDGLSPGDVGVSVGLVAATDDGRDAVPTPPADAPPAPPPAAVLPLAATPHRHAPPSGRVHVCDAARGKRSGVRLV